jgi:hypothetical protein
MQSHRKPLLLLCLALFASAGHAATIPAVNSSTSTPVALDTIAAQSLTANNPPALPFEADPLPNAPDPLAATAPNPQTTPPSAADSGPKQTKRILFIIPNFRSVSAETTLPPLSPKQKFKLVLDDTFDYSGFVEVGIIAGVSDLHKGEPAFGHGAIAYGRYYWHGLADNIDGNFMTEFLVPVATHEDPRYYTLGHGGLFKRTIYSVSRLAITRSDSGHATPNFAEIVGNGAASGISNFYYPSNDRSWTKTGQRWALQIGVDGLSNLAKEFWPDINAKIFHNKD